MHTLPFLIPQYRAAVLLALVAMAFELLALAWIRRRWSTERLDFDPPGRRSRYPSQPPGLAAGGPRCRAVAHRRRVRMLPPTGLVWPGSRGSEFWLQQFFGERPASPFVPVECFWLVAVFDGVGHDLG